MSRGSLQYIDKPNKDSFIVNANKDYQGRVIHIIYTRIRDESSQTYVYGAAYAYVLHNRTLSELEESDCDYIVAWDGDEIVVRGSKVRHPIVGTSPDSFDDIVYQPIVYALLGWTPDRELLCINYDYYSTFLKMGNTLPWSMLEYHPKVMEPRPPLTMYQWISRLISRWLWL